MRDNVTISYRGARYEIGRGQHFYGIWVAGAPQAQPLEWWPETPVGWSHAWARFTGIEVPGTIVAVSPPVPPPPPPAPRGPATSADAPPVSAHSPATAPDTPAVVDAPPAAPDASSIADAAPSTAAAASPDAASPAAASPDASPDTQDTDPGTSGQFGTPGTSDEPDESTVIVGQPIPAGTPAALALDQATASGPSTLRAAWARVGLGGGVAGLIIVGVILGIVGLFPAYLDGGTLVQEPASLVPHAIYFAAWFGAAVLILLGGPLRRLGALLAAGTSVVTFGLFFADAGTAISGGAHAMGAGLVLGLLGWLACAVGSGLAVGLKPAGQPAPGGPAGQTALGRPQRYGALHVLTLFTALGGLGTALAFAPSWDSYTLRAANGATTSVTLGNAFSNPGWVITGDVFTMISVVLIVIVAAAWRPVREGAWLLAGAIIPMAAQAISALVQVGEPTSPSLFGIPPASAAQAEITITNGLTPAFWLYCAFVVVLMATCGWILLSPRAVALDVPPAAYPSPYPPPYPPGAMPAGLHMPSSIPGAVPSALPGGAAPGYLPGGFEQVVQQQQLGDG